MNEIFKEDAQQDKFLTFILSPESYGIEITHVTEIIGLQKITRIPEMPDYVKGVINLRGKVIPVMDVRLRFRMKPRDYDERTCIVVIMVKKITVGLIVDTVEEVIEIPESSIDPQSRFSDGYGNQFMKGVARVGDTVKLLIEAESLIFRDAEHFDAAELEFNEESWSS